MLCTAIKRMDGRGVKGKMEKRIEEKTSRTAEMNCLVRAASYNEKDKRLASGDWVAPLILPPAFRAICKTRLIRAICRRLGARGMYEYIVMRTKYVDGLFERYADMAGQILIFGAGFDSRFVRFKDRLNNTACFELDSPVTQNAKKEQFNERGAEAPSNVVYIPIDFLKESVADKLSEYGFKSGESCIFVLEGLTMYLDEASMDATFKLLSGLSAKGSIAVFDYIHSEVISDPDSFMDGRDMIKRLEKIGERWTFGFAKGEAARFLERYGFAVEDEADSHALEQRYLGEEPGITNDSHVIVTARRI
jgi:methyltransferase (TIGR00027 family)